ncbi:MAG: phosphatidate cytidylyltransferase, partial [Candidatus Njordarchaeota archaeon]
YSTYEVRRKLTHLLAFIIVVPLPWLDQILLAIKYVLSIINPLFTISLSTNNLINFLVIALGISAIPIFLFVEYLRISRNVMLIPSNLLREHEKTSVASYIYSISSAFVVALLFSQIVLIASVLVGLIADAMAALVGVYYGKHKITKNRTLEGTIAGFITAFVTIYIIVQHVLASLCVAFTIAIFDALNVKEINDNFIFPILSAVVLSLFL